MRTRTTRIGGGGSGWHVLHEEEWYRVYTSPELPRIYESKFATGEASISFSDLLSRWPEWNEGDQVQFAQAFKYKPELTGEDEQILDFVMQQGGEMLSGSIATMVAKLRDRKRAAGFLTECLRAFPNTRGNFLCALAELAAPETTPNLLSVYKECADKIAENANDYGSIGDLLYCSAALYRITKEARYLDTITSYSRHPDNRIGNQAGNALRWAGGAEVDV